MVRKYSIVGIIFGILNILVALVPPVMNTFSVHYVLTEPPFPILDANPARRVDLAPPVWQHIHKDLPAYKPEVIGSSVCNAFLSLLLMVGAVGLFLNHDWGRWLSVGTALLMMVTFCIHDIYHLAIVRPSLTPVVARVIPPGPPGVAEGNQIGFTVFWYFWCWLNLGLMVYLLAMAVTLTLTRLLGGAPGGAASDAPAADAEPERRASRRRRDDD